ncbi:hypothetical protein F2Q68_00014919 [Brassica cretica]|uniref:Uncharacterized protein n=1 Tax=Brassica cretica TaxID=69181 RepID=A0A8S9HE45_BRACR|nr:hypothetical protein F2Q68_00014919 [Brassica cretica]
MFSIPYRLSLIPSVRRGSPLFISPFLWLSSRSPFHSRLQSRRVLSSSCAIPSVISMSFRDSPLGVWDDISPDLRDFFLQSYDQFYSKRSLRDLLFCLKSLILDHHALFSELVHIWFSPLFFVVVPDVSYQCPHHGGVLDGYRWSSRGSRSPYAVRDL